MKNPLLVGMAAILSGCAATGILYSEHPSSSTPVATHTAQLTVYRSSDNLQYSARSSSLKLDGTDVGGLAPGGFRTFGVAPGTHSLMVDMWDAPGRCELAIEVRAGSAYFYEVAPRVAALAAGTPGALLPGNTPIGFLVSGAAMLGGMAAESSGKRCGGAFSIVPVEQSLAMPKLAELRESR